MAGPPRKPVKLVDPTHPPEAEAALSAEEQRIRELETRLALSEGKKDPEPEWVEPTNPGSGENILIHVLEDGFTALGQVWFRGQEIEFAPNSRAYEDTKDRNGDTWLALRGNDFAQVERYGQVMFRPGPWPGKKYRDAKFEALKALSGDGTVSGPTQDELDRAEELERKRNRAAPTLPKM